MKVRQDAWSHEDDLLLAETVLRSIREGGTQLQAFEEVGNKLNRTAAACGFRWNAEVRKQYVKAIELAKKQRKEKKRAIDKQEKPNTYDNDAKLKHSSTPSVEYSTISLDSVISFLTKLKNDEEQTKDKIIHSNDLIEENKKLRHQINHLEVKLERLAEQHSTIQEDYKALIQIMDRARKMVNGKNEYQQEPPIYYSEDEKNNMVIN